MFCADCGIVIKRPLILKINKNEIYLYPNTRIYENHIVENGDYFKESGLVIINKANQSLLGLKNLSKQSWIVQYQNGDQKIIGQGEVALILKGTKIFFGNEFNGVIE